MAGQGSGANDLGGGCRKFMEPKPQMWLGNKSPRAGIFISSLFIVLAFGTFLTN